MTISIKASAAMKADAATDDLDVIVYIKEDLPIIEWNGALDSVITLLNSRREHWREVHRTYGDTRHWHFCAELDRCINEINKLRK